MTMLSASLSNDMVFLSHISKSLNSFYLVVRLGPNTKVTSGLLNNFISSPCSHTFAKGQEKEAL